MNIHIVRGNIAKARNIDAVVNSTNTEHIAKALVGVNKDILRRGGEDFEERCRNLPKGEVGHSMIIEAGGKLKFKWVIHTVAPENEGSEKHMNELRSCYLESLRIASEKGAKSVLFPPIGVGYHKWSASQTMEIALDAISEFDKDKSHHLSKIYFISNNEQYIKDMTDAVKKRGLLFTGDTVNVRVDIECDDYKQLVDALIKLSLNKIAPAKKLPGLDRVLGAVCGNITNDLDTSVETFNSLPDTVKNMITDTLTRYIERYISKSTGVYVRLRDFSFAANGTSLELCSKIEGIDYSEIFAHVSRSLSKLRNIYKRELVPLALSRFDESFSIEDKHKFLAGVINEMSSDIRKRITDGFIKRLNGKTGLNLDFRLSSLTVE